MQLTALDDGAPASGSLAWKSLDEGAATVSASGLVTGVAVGAARIVASGRAGADTITVNVTPEPELALTSGRDHACVLDVAGKAFCWGANASGQLGNGGTAGSPAPVAVAGGFTFAQIEAGGNSTCALTRAGEAYCWGAGGQGQLGNGSSANTSAPARVTMPQPLASISMGGADVACGLGRDGTAYCWGANRLGNAGTGNKVATNVPVAVATALRFSRLETSAVHTCGITAQGAAYCWGRGDLGSLGTGDFQERLVPAPVAGGLSFGDFTVGAAATCGISGGATFCWGLGLTGALGLGRTTQPEAEAANPARMPGSEVFVKVEAGGEDWIYTPTCLLTASGEAYCTGGNTAGQLGTSEPTESCRINSTTNRPCSTRPLRVSGGHSFATVKPGAEFVCALTPDGRAYCWGSNSMGQLGTPAGGQSSTPVQVAALLRLP